MAQKKSLRALGPDDTPPPVLSLADAVARGNYLEILLAQRREIATSIPDEKGPAKAALHRQLSIVSKEIESLRVKESEDIEFGGEAEDDFDATAI